MEQQFSLSISMKPAWDIINEIQEKAIEFLESRGKEKKIIDAAMICVTELVENSVKYGVQIPGDGYLDFHLLTDALKLLIKVTSGVEDGRDISSLFRHIDSIKTATDPEELYAKRLQELMDDPKPGATQLGLFRIAYEGKFKLDYHYKQNVLTVSAQRDL